MRKRRAPLETLREGPLDCRKPKDAGHLEISIPIGIGVQRYQNAR
jgi:hypothetical protein